MALWKYDISTVGGPLRRAIHESEEDTDSCINILEKLLECLNHLKVILPESTYTVFFEDIESDLSEDLVDLKEDFDVLYAYAQDVVNEHLEDFYDACDAAKIWVGV